MPSSGSVITNHVDRTTSFRGVYLREEDAIFARILLSDCGVIHK